MTSVIRFDTSDATSREEGIAAATGAIRRAELAIIPTDTVYGVAGDAFSPLAVRRLLDAKGRGREMPPPVLVGSAGTINALITDAALWVSALVDRYWPGPLTLVCRSQPSLQWDLGDTLGTVAVRMPDDAVTLELLARTGPLAVSSANLTGMPAATSADLATTMLGESVEVVLDSGASPGGVASTILDCTSAKPRILREGGIATAELAEFLRGHGVELEA